MLRDMHLRKEQENSNMTFCIDLAYRQGNKKSPAKLYRDIYGGSDNDYKPLNKETRDAMENAWSEEFKAKYEIVKAHA